MFKNFGLGIRTYGTAISFLFNKGLAYFFIFPLLYTILLFFGGFALFERLEDYVFKYILDLVKNIDWLSSGIGNDIFTGFLWLVLKIIYFFIFRYIGGFFILLLLSPVLAALSEKTEKIINGKDYPFSFGQFFLDLFRGLFITLRNLVIELFFTVLLFFMGFIPVIGFFAPIVLFFISSYYFGFSFFDYSNERHKRNVQETVSFINLNKGTVMANGMVYALGVMLPFCGLFLPAFLSIVSVTAATIAVNEIQKKNNATTTEGIDKMKNSNVMP